MNLVERVWLCCPGGGRLGVPMKLPICKLSSTVLFWARLRTYLTQTWHKPDLSGRVMLDLPPRWRGVWTPEPDSNQGPLFLNRSSLGVVR